MAGYGGYFLQGLASGLESGVNLGMKLTQLRWAKQKKKEMDDLQAKMSDTWNTIGQEIISLANDGQLSDDDLLKVYTITIAAPYQMQDYMQNLRNSLSQFNTKDFDKQMEYVRSFYEYAQGLDPKDIDTLYETFRKQITNPHALTLFEVADKKLRHEYEMAQEAPTPEVFRSVEELREKYPNAGYTYSASAGGYVPTYREPEKAEVPTVKASDYTTAVNYLSKFKYAKPEIFEKIKAGYQKQFPHLDLSAITQESLREPKIEQVPEGEVTAGEKRSWDMASSVLFGSSDWVTGISKPGIISTTISNKLNMGQPLTNEEKAEVRNNYNLIKDTLPSEVQNIVESQLRRYGIPLEEIPEPTPAPTLEPTPEPKKRWWEFWKKETPTETPTETPIPKTEEIPTPKMSTEQKEALIPLMTKKELEDLIKTLDSSDPLYKLVYDEAVRRGYITK